MAVDVRIGQGHRITIPKALRDEIGLEAGDYVAWTLEEDGVLMRKASEAEIAASSAGRRAAKRTSSDRP